MVKLCFGTALLTLILIACGEAVPSSTTTDTDSAERGAPTARPGAGAGRPLPTGTPVTIIYQGQALPTPEPIFLPPDPPGEPTAGQRRRLNVPPPAWLLVGDQATPASYGSFCYYGTCADYLPPAMRDDLVTATIPANAQARIIIGSSNVSLEAVQLHAWNPSATFSNLATPTVLQAVKVEGEREDHITVFIVESVDDVDQQVLSMMVRFAGAGDGMYLWQLMAE